MNIGELVPIMFEYFYLSKTCDKLDREFEFRSLYRNIKSVKYFLKQQNYYCGDGIVRMFNYESMVLNTMQ